MKTRIEKLLGVLCIIAILGTGYIVLSNPPINSYLPSPDFIDIQIQTVLIGFLYYLGYRVNIFLDLFYLASQTIYDLLVIFGLKKKRPFWGTVYDSVSKQPLDPVIVTLKDAKTGEKVEQAITDIYGRFGFLMRKGSFMLEAQKKGYRFPSIIIRGDSDGIFGNLYHGGQVDILNPTDVVAPNIPMDRLEEDFNQEAKKKIIRFNPHLGLYANLALNILFAVALLNATYNYIYFPNVLNNVLIIVYLIALIYKLWPKHRLWGRIINRATKEPFYDLQLELVYPAIGDVVVGKAETNRDGKYFLKAKPGRYILKIKRIWSKSPFWAQSVIIGQEGIFDEDLEI